VAAPVFDFLAPDESARRAAAIAALTLDGKTLTANVANAIQDIPYERSIEGASTVNLMLIDPDGDLLDSGLFSASVDIELPAPSWVIPPGQDLPVPSGDSLGFRLVSIKSPAAVLNLQFEDREVASARAHKEIRHASRADVTRAEFIRSLVRVIRSPQPIRFWSPELRIVQPIQSVRDVTPAKKKTEQRDPGFGSDTPKVKRRDATRQQIRYLEQALDTAQSLKANERCQIGLVEAMTQESVVSNDRGREVQVGTGGLRGTQLVDVGVLHQAANGAWPASRNIPRDVAAFTRKLIPVEKAHRDKSIGWCVDQVQASYTFGTSRQGRDYDQWESEATETVAAYTGDAGLTVGIQQTTEYRKRYEFRTTEPGADEREDWWSATGRLAAEVNFRRFIDYGVFHYVSDDYLRKAQARLKISRKNLPPGVLSVDIGDFDTGKPRRNSKGQNVGGAEVRVDVLTDVLAPPLGGVWILDGYGPCDGRYLITNVRGSYLSPVATVTMTLPVPKLAEPAPATGTRATTRDGTVQRSFSGSSIADAYDAAWKINDRRYPYVWGGGHLRAGTPDTGQAGTAHDELTDREHIGYDCSGSTAAVLLAGGMLPDEWKNGVPASGTFAQRWGSPGKGRYMTVWANSVHVFIEFHGLTSANKTEHFGTGRWGKDWSGPGFNPNLHPHDGFVARHWTREANPVTAPTGKPNLRN
jgi:hypothetical protein